MQCCSIVITRDTSVALVGELLSDAVGPIVKYNLLHRFKLHIYGKRYENVGLS